MAKPVVSKRHRPSVRSYFRQNIATTFARAEEAHVMAALGWLFLSAIFGTITGFAVPLAWEHRWAIGLAVFIIVQFGIITPMRMWRDDVWVQNVEKSLDALWDLHEEGTVLLNEHIDQYIKTHPHWKEESEATNQWVEDWVKKLKTWEDKTKTALAAFYPLDALRFKNVVTFNPGRLSGMTEQHVFHVNLLATKLEKMSDMLEKHHPSQLPE